MNQSQAGTPASTGTGAEASDEKAVDAQAHAEQSTTPVPAPVQMDSADEQASDASAAVDPVDAAPRDQATAEGAPADQPPAAPQADKPLPGRFGDVVSGQFDADEESPEVAPPKRVLQPQPETPKLHKILAQAGLGSRLEMEQLIMEGRISVNNEPAHIGQRIQFGDQVKVNGKPIRIRIDPPPPRVIAYHKPTGEVVTNDDPQNRPTVFRKLPKLFQGKWQSVGRLDLNTEGLLLFTSSGELANQLMHPRFGLEREYAVRVLGALSNEEKQRLLDGVKLDDGMAQFGSIEDGGGEGSNCWYRVTISEGRNREVRRMLEAVGHAVSRLIRIRYGAMLLPRGLKRGGWLELDDRDIQALMRAAGSAPERQARGEGGGDREGARGRNGRNGRGGGGQQQAPGQGRDKGRGGRGGGRGQGMGAGAGGGQQRDPNRVSNEIPNPLTTNTIGAGGGQRRPDRQNRSGGGGGGGGGDGQPDPMKTAFGYIGADSFTRQRRGPGQGQGPQQQRRSGGGGGGGGGGGPRGGAGGNRRGGRGR